MACKEHGNRPPCDLKHSKPKMGYEKRSLGYLLNRVGAPSYEQVDQDNYKSIAKDEMDLK